jgi:hypothetical protein
MEMRGIVVLFTEYTISSSMCGSPNIVAVLLVAIMPNRANIAHELGTGFSKLF